jgi:FSR family fosmidomycin resistance protein-like MFS transporter
LPDDDGDAHWASYFTLICVVSMAGMVYASMITFMPRYLEAAGLDLIDGLEKLLARLGFQGVSLESIGVANFLTSGVLLLGILGQFTAGRIAKPTTLEPLMALAFLCAAPCMLWMGLAEGTGRIWAAAVFAPVFFMHQPLFNSLVAKYTPRRRRSLCYGLSFTLGFGVGSLGPILSGMIRSVLLSHAILATLLAVAGSLTVVLWRWHGPIRNATDTEGALL